MEKSKDLTFATAMSAIELGGEVSVSGDEANFTWSANALPPDITYTVCVVQYVDGRMTGIKVAAASSDVLNGTVVFDDQPGATYAVFLWNPADNRPLTKAWDNR